MKILFYAAGAIVALHGLVHLMGLVAYWPLGAVPELPYKTALLGGHWEVGRTGMRIFGALWLLAAVGFAVAAAGLLTRQGWWTPVMLATLVLSTGVVLLDWAAAFRGAVLNAIILLVMGIAYLRGGTLTWLP